MKYDIFFNSYGLNIFTWDFTTSVYFHQRSEYLLFPVDEGGLLRYDLPPLLPDEAVRLEEAGDPLDGCTDLLVGLQTGKYKFWSKKFNYDDFKKSLFN